MLGNNKTRKIANMVLVLMVLLVGCGNQQEDNIYISAASSLTESIKEIGQVFQETYSQVEVNLNFAATSILKTQILEGAKVSLFLSANKEHYDELVAKGYIVEGQKFATNELVLITQQDNDKINSFKDISKSGISVLLANEEVPIGRYALAVLEDGNKLYGEAFKEMTLNNVVSREANVKQVWSKVKLGEADCGIVYRSDVIGTKSEELKVINIPEEINVEAEYWIGILKQDKTNAPAKELYNMIISENGKQILKKYGFR